MKRSYGHSHDWDPDDSLEEWAAQPGGGFAKVRNLNSDAPVKRMALGLDNISIVAAPVVSTMRPLSDAGDGEDEEDDDIGADERGGGLVDPLHDDDDDDYASDAMGDEGAAQLPPPSAAPARPPVPPVPPADE